MKRSIIRACVGTGLSVVLSSGLLTAQQVLPDAWVRTPAGLLEVAKAYVAQGRNEDAIRTLQEAIAQLRADANQVAGAAPAPAGTPVRIGGDVKAPTKIFDVSPLYPAEARAARVQGRVILEAIVNETGDVVDIRVLRPLPMLDDAAIRAVSQWKYTPTLVQGSPVPVVMTVTVDFSLD